MYRQQIAKKISPSLPSTPINTKTRPISSRDYLSGVIQRARANPETLGRDEWLQLDSAIGTRATNEIKSGKRTSYVPKFKGISAKLWGDSGQVDAPIQKKEKDDVGVYEVHSENKTGLPDNLKAGVENLSGYSLDNVRVHYNSSKPAQLEAFAYTQGIDIHVAPGQEKHLPHETWHVVQQMQGRVKPTMQVKGVKINDNQELETEADVMGDKVGYKQSGKKAKTVDPTTQAQIAGTVVQANKQKLLDTRHYKYKKQGKERKLKKQQQRNLQKEVNKWIEYGHAEERHVGLNDKLLDNRRIPLATTFESNDDLFVAAMELIKTNAEKLNNWYENKTKAERITLWVWRPDNCNVKGRRKMERPDWHSKMENMPPHPGYEDVDENELNIIFGVFDRDDWHEKPLGLITCFPGIKETKKK